MRRCPVLRLGAVLVAVAWALAGWRNLPPLEQPQASAAGLAIGATCFLSYLFGSRSTLASATATATARAEAHAAALAQSNSSSNSTAQVAVVISPGMGAASVGATKFGGLDSAPWMIGATRDEELEQDWLEQATLDGEGEEAAEHAPG